MSDAKVFITLCGICTDTCEAGEAGIGGGARLYEKTLARLADSNAGDQVSVRSWRCLMACPDGCVASVGAPGRMQYLLGRLPASDEVADALLSFAVLYAQSPTGIIPNHTWPSALVMNFMGRLPPIQPNRDADWTQTGCDL